METETKGKRKGAANGITSSPFEIENRAATTPSATRGKSRSGEVELQEKMEMATKEFNELLIDRLYRRYDDPYESMPRDLFIFKALSPSVQYTRSGIFYLFEGQWVRVIEDDIFDGSAPEYIRESFKKYGGKVSWVLPKIQKGGAE